MTGRAKLQMNAMGKTTMCSIEGCELKIVGRDLCRKHYGHLWRTGDIYTRPTRRNIGIGDTPEQRFWSRVALTADDQRCWEWQGCVSSTGYGKLQVNHKNAKAHRAAWYFVKGVWPTLHLLHSCDNPLCVNPNHLSEGTNLDNRLDSKNKGRHAHGETSGLVKLTEKDVRIIREAAGRSTYKELAAQFGVGVANIGCIVTRKTWSHI